MPRGVMVSLAQQVTCRAPCVGTGRGGARFFATQPAPAPRAHEAFHALWQEEEVRHAFFALAVGTKVIASAPFVPSFPESATLKNQMKDRMGGKSQEFFSRHQSFLEKLKTHTTLPRFDGPLQEVMQDFAVAFPAYYFGYLRSFSPPPVHAPPHSHHFLCRLTEGHRVLISLQASTAFEGHYQALLSATQLYNSQFSPALDHARVKKILAIQVFLKEDFPFSQKEASAKDPPGRRDAGASDFFKHYTLENRYKLGDILPDIEILQFFPQLYHSDNLGRETPLGLEHTNAVFHGWMTLFKEGYLGQGQDGAQQVQPPYLRRAYDILARMSIKQCVSNKR